MIIVSGMEKVLKSNIHSFSGKSKKSDKQFIRDTATDRQRDAGYTQR